MRFVSGHLHGHSLRYGGSNEIANRCPTEVVRDASGTTSGDTRLSPGLIKAALGYAVARFHSLREAEHMAHDRASRLQRRRDLLLPFQHASQLTIDVVQRDHLGW